MRGRGVLGCAKSRVMVINHGKLVHDGDLSDLTDKFSRTKLVKLEFAGEAPDDLLLFGEVTRREGPSADLKVEKARVAQVLAGDPRPLLGDRP